MSDLSFGKIVVHRRVTAALLVSVIGVLGGCAERRVQARNWTNTGEVRPNPPLVRTAAQTGSDDIEPDLTIGLPENGTKFFAGRPVPPPRPRVEPPRPSGGPTAPKSSTLVPELSPAEAATAQQQFSESVSIAEKNLGIAKTKNLSTIQADTVAKINAFLTEAREASTEGDWGRARNLAKKAQILSEDLAASL